MADQLLFIYNVGSSLPEGVLSILKKQVGRQQCGLCTITYGVVRKKALWTNIEKRLPFPITYYHKDDMPSSVRSFLHEQHLELPVVLFRRGGHVSFVAGKGDIDACRGDALCLEAKIVAHLHGFQLRDTINKDTER